MTNKDIARQSLLRNLEEYKKAKFRTKKELDELTKEIVERIKLVHQVNLINNEMVNEYLSHVEKKYLDTLHQEQFKEYRNLVINFNDDFVNNLERQFIRNKNEIEYVKSMDKWKKAVNASASSSASAGNKNELDENYKSIQTQRKEVEPVK